MKNTMPHTNPMIVSPRDMRAENRADMSRATQQANAISAPVWKSNA